MTQGSNEGAAEGDRECSTQCVPPGARQQSSSAGPAAQWANYAQGSTVHPEPNVPSGPSGSGTSAGSPGPPMPGNHGGQHGEQPTKKPLNAPGLAALILAGAGAICASTPQLFAVGWAMLAIAIVLSVVGLLKKNKGRATSIAALFITAAGILFGSLVYVAFTTPAVSDIFGPAQSPRSTETAGTGTDQNVRGEAGTEANPLPLGSTITQGDWQLTVNGVDLDATGEVLEENQYNQQPADGEAYILVSITMRYVGDAQDEQTPRPKVAYQTADGQTRERFDTEAVPPDAFYEAGALANGEETTGNIVFTVPAATAARGALTVQAHTAGETIYVAVE